jgi:hypothetical protein
MFHPNLKIIHMKILIMNHIEMILKYEIQFFFVKINFILIKKEEEEDS